MTQHLASFPKTASEHQWNTHKPSFASLASCSSSALTVSYAVPCSVCSSSSRTQSWPLVTPPWAAHQDQLWLLWGKSAMPTSGHWLCYHHTTQVLFSYAQGLSQDSLSEILHRNLGLRWRVLHQMSLQEKAHGEKRAFRDGNVSQLLEQITRSSNSFSCYFPSFWSLCTWVTLAVLLGQTGLIGTRLVCTGRGQVLDVYHKRKRL